MATTVEARQLKLGDTREPLGPVFFSGTRAWDLLAFTSWVFRMWPDEGTCPVTYKVNTSDHILVEPLRACEADEDLNALKCYDHGAERGDQVVFVPDAESTLPSPLRVGERYYVKRTLGDHYFTVAIAPQEKEIKFEDLGTGTFKFRIKGHIQYQWQTADVDTLGLFHAEFAGTDADGRVRTFPGDANAIPITFVKDRCDAE